MGYVLGTPGGSVAEVDGDAGAIEAGRRGELKTGEVLARVAEESDRVVLHDLSVPARGNNANIDHLVIGGSTILAIDSKMWAPGLYWTLGEVSYRWLEVKKGVDNQTMTMIQERLALHLPGCVVKRPILCVWPSRGGWTNLSLLKPRGADALPAHRLERFISKNVPNREPSGDALERLIPLLRDTGQAPRRRRRI